MRTVLVADPNPIFAEVIADALQRLSGVQVLVAATGPETLRRAAEAAPQLVVLDGDLPECSLAELIKALRGPAPALPVIVMPVEGAGLPADITLQGVLPKPFFMPDLAGLVNQLLGPPPAAASPAPAPRPISEPPATKPRPALGAHTSHTGLLRARVASVSPPPPPAEIKHPVPPAANGTPAAPLTAPPTVALPADVRRRVESRIELLSHALRDEPVFLTQAERLVLGVPRLSGPATAALVDMIRRAWETPESPREVIRFVGDSETARYMLYSVRVSASQNLVLSAALRMRIPLPILRRVIHETANDLAGLLPAAL